MPQYVVFIVYITFVEIVWKREKNILFFCFMKSIFIVNSQHVGTYKRQEQLKLNISPSKVSCSFPFTFQDQVTILSLYNFLYFVLKQMQLKVMQWKACTFEPQLFFCILLVKQFPFHPICLLQSIHILTFISIPCNNLCKSIQ